MPLEEEAEARGGRLPQTRRSPRSRREAIEAGLAGGLHSPEAGGQGWTRTEWVLVEEQYGRSTNAINWHVPNAYNVWEHASEEQVDRYLRPALRGEAKDAYAVTERGAGSDPSRIEATAERTDGGFVINAEKWFVTSGDVATVIVVMANLIDGARPAADAVRRRHATARASRSSTTPTSRTAIPDRHPTIRFTDVEVGPDDVHRGVGGGDELQRSWFSEERLGIAARGVGAMWRLLEETVDWATSREQGGERIYDYQGVSLPARRLGGRRRRRPAARPPGRGDDRRRRRPQARPPQGLDGEAVRQRGGLAVRRPLRAGVRRAVATCARTSPSDSCASSASTGSGRAPARSSG